jgi:hypothetical protein
MFFFFLILGLSDPLNLFSVSVLQIKPGLIHSVAALLLFYSLNFKDKQKLKISYTDILVVVLFLSAVFIFYNLFYLTLIIHFLILARFIQIFVIDLHQISELNIFYLVLVFYEISIVINLFVLLGESEKRMFLFFITLTFQFLIAIFFTIYREDNPHLRVKLKS